MKKLARICRRKVAQNRWITGLQYGYDFFQSHQARHRWIWNCFFFASDQVLYGCIQWPFFDNYMSKEISGLFALLALVTYTWS